MDRLFAFDRRDQVKSFATSSFGFGFSKARKPS